MDADTTDACESVVYHRFFFYLYNCCFNCVIILVECIHFPILLQEYNDLKTF